MPRVNASRFTLHDSRVLKTAYIGLGANLGDPWMQIQEAIRRVKIHPELHVRAVSKLRWTPPDGGPPQPHFLNGVMELQTALQPEALLVLLQRIESGLGRDRANEMLWGPRVIDLDLLIFEDYVCRTDQLELPHPRLAVRAFVLEPLADIASSVVVPSSGATVNDLWHRLQAQATEQVSHCANVEHTVAAAA